METASCQDDFIMSQSVLCLNKSEPDDSSKVEPDTTSVNQRPQHCLSIPRILRVFIRSRVSTLPGIFRGCESPYFHPAACCGPLGAPSPWLPTGNSRWVT